MLNQQTHTRTTLALMHTHGHMCHLTVCGCMCERCINTQTASYGYASAVTHSSSIYIAEWHSPPPTACPCSSCDCSCMRECVCECVCVFGFDWFPVRATMPIRRQPTNPNTRGQRGQGEDLGVPTIVGIKSDSQAFAISQCSWHSFAALLPLATN